MTIMTLYSNFSGNVFADNSWNCLLNFCFQRLLKTATYCCQTERQIQRDAWGSAHTERVAQQCMHANCLQIIHKKQWPPNFPNLNPLQITSGKRYTKLGENMEKFSAEQSCPEC